MLTQFFHYNPIYLLLQLLNSFLQHKNVGVEDWFPQRPHFLQLYKLFLFFCTTITNRREILPYHGIQVFLVDTVVGGDGVYTVEQAKHILLPLLRKGEPDHAQ